MAGKTVVVIGGTTGLGLSGAKALQNEGANLVVLGRNPESVAKAQDELGESAIALVGDATESNSAVSTIAAAIERWGRLDALYHVAGGSGRKFGDGPLHEVTDDGIEKTLSMNLESVIASNRAAVQQFMKQGDGGVVLNMGSVLGHSPSAKFFATHVYAAAKAGIEGFTSSCAAYYAQANIRFNVICPALVETPMATRAVGNETIQAFIKTKQPLDGGRVSQPTDLDAAVILLLSDQSRLITGQVLNVDGGWCVSEGQLPQSHQ